MDIVLELPSWKVKEFCAAFPAPEFYADADFAMRAAAQGDQFNILHFPSGLKADILIFTDTPFNESSLSRSRLVWVPSGNQVRMASPEDIILKKLAYLREGRSEKHMSDISGVIREVSDLDLRYIADWALRTGVWAEWRAVADRLGLPQIGPGGPVTQ